MAGLNQLMGPRNNRNGPEKNPVFSRSEKTELTKKIGIPLKSEKK
jgi:hypothetical protein